MQLVDELEEQSPCADCGVSYPSYVMDFDHRDARTKLDSISTAVRILGWGPKKLMAEIAKCDLVCANCHRKRTHARRTRL